MKEALRKISVSDLVALVRRYSEAYKKSEAFQTAIGYLVNAHPDEDYKKEVLYTELKDALGEDLAREEIDYLLREEEERENDNTSICIDGVDYKVIESDIINPFDRMAAVKPGEAVRYYDKYMYRTASGEARACYADNPSNNWGV